MIEFLSQPWAWYVSGILIGLTVPVLLVIGNKSFGISSSLRHVCAMCVPANIPFFNYDWKKEIWNLFFVVGIFIGGFLATQFLSNTAQIQINPALQQELANYNISDYSNLIPIELMNWQSLFTLKGFLLMVVGGFLVGFGTRYAGGCTSGHAIMGLSTLQKPSLIATISFFVGGLIMANLILPFILQL